MRTRSCISWTLLLLTALLTPTTSLADKAFRYPEGKHGKGELKYEKGIPILRVEGSPEEIVNDPDVRRLYLGEEFRL